jgi:hypothetical protein
VAISGDGNGCNVLSGRFLVRQAVVAADGTVLRFAADFEQHCEDAAPALYGAIRYQSGVSIVPLLSIGDAKVIEEPSGAPVDLTISLSGPASEEVRVDYATAAGTALADSDYVATSGTVTFTPPETSKRITIQTLNDGAAEGDKELSINLSDPSGASIAFGQAHVTILDSEAPQTYLYLNSQPDDFIGQGQKQKLTVIDGVFTPYLSPESVRIQFRGDAWWDATFAAPAGESLAPGIYENARRWVGVALSQPSLDISGDGRGCNELTGRFAVREVSHAGDGSLLTFAADFEQHCESGEPALFGSVRFNSSIPVAPLLTVGDAAAVEGASGASMTFTIALSEPAVDPVTVDFSTSNGTAVAGSDYVAASGSVTFAPSETSQQVTIDTLNDGVGEGTQRFYLNLSNPTGAVIVGGQGVGTIYDSDGPRNVLVLNSQPGDPVGLGQQQTLTELDGAFSATTSGGFTYVGFSGDTSWDFQFGAPGNAVPGPGVYEGAEDFYFRSPLRPGLDVWGGGRSCSGITGRFVVLEASYDGAGNVLTFAANFEQHCHGEAPALFGSIRINSALPVVPRLSVAGATLIEGPAASPMTFTLSLSQPASEPVTVDFATSNGTALAGSDYVAASGSVTFPPSVTSQEVTVETLNDGAAEGSQYFYVNLTNPGGAPIANGQATGTILDSEGPQTFLVLNSQPGDYIGQGVEQTLTTLGGTFSAITDDQAVRIHFAGDTLWDLAFAAPGGAVLVPGIYERAEDYPFQSSPRPGLSVSGDSRGCESTGRFVVLEAPYDASQNVLSFAADFEQLCEGSTAPLFGAIRFNSILPVVPLLSIADAGVLEGPAGTPLTLTVSLSQPASDPVSVDYSTSNGTAFALSDYEPASGSVTFAPGETSRQITVQTLNDGAAEGTQRFYVDLANPAGAGIAFGRATATILDSDGPQTFLAVDSQPGDDVGNGRRLTLTSLDAGFLANHIDRVVHLEVSGDTSWDLYLAAPGDAFLTPGTYERAAMYGYQTPTQPALWVRSDFGSSCYAITGRFTVYEATYDAAGNPLTFAANFEQHCNGQAPALYGAIRLNSSYPVIPRVGRPGQFEFSAPSYTAGEGAAAATIAVKRLLGSSGPATVDYSTGDGTATGGEDYAATSGTLTFAAGQTLKAFLVPVIRDAADEPNETLVVRLSSPQPALHGATLGPQTAAVLTIVDDDAGGTVQFSPTAVSVNAATGPTSARLTVRRAGGLASGVTVHCTMTDGTATGGVDYDSTPQDVTFAYAGTSASTQILTIPVSQNTSGTKTFTVTLSAPTAGATLGTATVATVTTLGAQPTLSFSSAAVTVKTTQAGALITVKRSVPSNSTVTVHYATSPGTAANGGVDYTDVSGTLTFGPTVLSTSFTVPITKDPLLDTPKTVNLTLSSPTWSLGTAALDPVLATATLTIVNPNLAPTVQFAAAIYTASEAMPRGVVTVKRTGDLVGTVTVEYAVTGGSATNGDPAVDPESDYRLNAGVLTFAPNVTAQSIPIPIVNDTRMEGTETAQITLSSPTWTGGTALVGAIGTATLNILDNEPTVQFSQAAYSVGEAARSVTIVVKRTGSAVSAASVAYAVTGGSAIPDTGAGGDYVPPAPGTLSFLPGQLQKTFVITLQPDTWVDGSRTIELALSSPTGAGLGTPSTAVVTIKDDDVAGKVQFGAAALSVTETSGTATVTVTRTGGAAGPVTIAYATLDSDPGTTAVPGTDYTSTSGTLTFNWNEETRTFTVPILDDGVSNSDAVSVRLALSTPGGGLVLASLSTAALWIVKE